ncbi:helix-turn-helix domain-containing protein [Mucilaginibacter sp. L3T2-6]|uniref:helix-turn-helix domain-containing protein n=1 Tax=Mucilaginibacter sp. L3T2-6 TaxID=3062491 RepID=UPI002676F40C|nr:helix-turn-helix domain-containing protein [Mucilaginibacter sp. L3T2-6]MDO3641948.1 helix-turn-helix domain-containing protein [Mucilaginibacter sp. L3T2-6]MDV6214374.1 helix-turn-helix domain-containing protein [Mucilaginibacter sp. L3T2-6]
MIFCNHTIFNIKSVSCMFPLYLPKRETSNYDEIIKLIGDTFGISAANIKGKSRQEDIVDARYIAIYFIKRNNRNISLKQLGAIFSKRDHSTMIYALDKFNNLYATDRHFKRKVQLIESRLNRKDCERI